MSHLCKLFQRKKVLKNFQKFISQEWNIRPSISFSYWFSFSRISESNRSSYMSFLRNEFFTRILEKFISQEWHMRISIWFAYCLWFTIINCTLQIPESEKFIFFFNLIKFRMIVKVIVSQKSENGQKMAN